VLRLSGEGAGPAVPAEDTPAPAAEPQPEQMAPPNPMPQQQAQAPQQGQGGVYPMPEFAQRRAQEFSTTLRAYVDRTYRALRPGEFYSSGFLTEGRQLPLGRMMGDVTPQQIRNLSESTVPSLYSQVGIRAPEGATYAAGDSLLVVQLGDEYRGFGMAVVPTALVRVTGRAENQFLGEVVAIYGPVRAGQFVIPAERFSPGGESRAVAVSDGVRGGVIGGRELRELKHPQNVLFIDVGREQGVAVGDLFEVRREPGPRPGAADNIEETMAAGQIVRVGDRSATLLLLNIMSPDIPPGTPVLQVARLPRGADR